MKRILIPQQQEEACFYSDFTGKPFDEGFDPPVTLKLEFSYGSIYDGSEITLHLSDDDVGSILDLIQSKLNSDTKSILSRELDNTDRAFEEALEARDVVGCDAHGACSGLLRRLLGLEIQ